jgi:methionyl-tRNA synthetase
MNDFSDWIKKFLLKDENFLIPNNRRSEIINNFIDKGLENLSVSRVSVD